MLNFVLHLQPLAPDLQTDLTSPANDYLWDPADLAREFSFLTNIFNKHLQDSNYQRLIIIETPITMYELEVKSQLGSVNCILFHSHNVSN